MPKYLFAQNVTTEELDAIKNFKPLGPRQFQRGRLVELSTTGWRCQQIATAVGLCVSRVRAWIHRFNQQRLPGLMAKKSPGRLRKFPKEIRDRIRALVGDCPRDDSICGASTIGKTRWTLADVCSVAKAFTLSIRFQRSTFAISLSRSVGPTLAPRSGNEVPIPNTDDAGIGSELWKNG